jgi:hypothetical protein
MSRNNSETGGYILPAPTQPALATIPPNLTLVQFIQSLLVGVSGLPGPLVRPEWQVNPPPQPELNVDWAAYGISGFNPDFNAYIAGTVVDDVQQVILQTNEELPISISTYGPNSYDNMGLIRDGLQMTQNLSLLRQANIGFGYFGQALHVPDLVNERWIDRWRAEFVLRRQVQRFYPVLNFVSVSGTIYSQTAVNDNYTVPFASNE